MKNRSKVEHMKFSTAMLVLLLSMAIIGMLSGCGNLFSSETFTISGTITSGGSPLPGVKVTLSGDDSGVVTTDNNGNYSFDTSNYSTDTITPSLAGYTFRPINRTATIYGLSGSGFNFSGFGSGEVWTTRHTVYLKSDGTVWTWGYNSNGQLGNGNTNNSDHYVQVINTDLSPFTGVTAVAAGYDHTVALKNDGTVWAWGSNSNGQLGNGPGLDSYFPVQVGGLSGVTAVAAGYQFTIALQNYALNTTIWTWGVNNHGQLGNNSTTPSSIPVQVSQTSGLLNVIGVAAGYDHAVALMNATGGIIWTWGNNGNGELGIGTTTDSYIPVQVGGLANIMAIAAGNAFTIALRNDPPNTDVWTWGSNYNGQLGDGATSDVYTPVAVSGMSGTGAIGVAAGYDHAVVMKTDGTVWAWGGNSHGQLGNGTTTGSVTPVQVSGMSGVEAIAAGYFDTAALKIDSTVWTWGYNAYGQLGNNSMIDSLIPVQAM
ncbi:MAG: carboxypeptidase-like regulatory domain-containing protein [Syntrophales bacterium]|jgi:alpha-tubulin suppressor-like RCC1 family protein